MGERAQSPGEEIANATVHGLALLAALAAMPMLVLSAWHLSMPRLIGMVVFAATMVLVYLSSTLYHVLPPGRAKELALKLDYGAIYLFIAGSYTPFASDGATGTWSGMALALVWAVACLGILLKSLDRLAHPLWSSGLYLALGWLVLGAATPMAAGLAPQAMAWLVAGGLVYSLGLVFYLLDTRVLYAHSVWHGFVAAGSTCHVMAVLAHVA